MPKAEAESLFFQISKLFRRVEPGYWQVVAGRTYRFQLKGNLSDTDWTTVGEDYTAESSTVEVTDEAGTNRHGFYRVLDVTAP